MDRFDLVWIGHFCSNQYRFNFQVTKSENLSRYSIKKKDQSKVFETPDTYQQIEAIKE